MKQYRLDMDLKPYPHLTLLFQAESLHVATRYNGLYGSSGSFFLKAPPAGFTSDIGTGFDTSAKYAYHESLIVQAGVGHYRSIQDELSLLLHTKYERRRLTGANTQTLQRP
jgi:hypothetical protein